jgi:membrane protease subunit (stomatin/prohibitin family)
MAQKLSEPGGFTWHSNDQNSKSFLAGDGIFSSTFKTSWQRFKFGGEPSSQQLALFVNLKELPNNRFGTQSEIFYDDGYINAQVGLTTRGSYTLKIVDPLLFVKNFVPAEYLTPNSPAFDFTDAKNDYATQLFNEVVASLSGAFSSYTNDDDKGHRITKIQGDSVGFAKHLVEQVEDDYHWLHERGLLIVKVAIMAIQYDKDTEELLHKVQQADALMGNRGNSNLQASVAAGMEEAGQHGAEGLFGLGMAGGVAGGMGGLQQPTSPAPAQGLPSVDVPPPAPAQNLPPVEVPPPAPATAAPPTDDPYVKLTKLKGLLDGGVISQEEFDTAKAKVLSMV